MNVHFRAFHGPSDWGWVLQHLPLKRVEDTGGIVAIDADTNRTVAMCIMDTWSHNAVQVHLILDNPLVLRHGFFEEVADYVYNVAERNVMVGLVPSSNHKALQLDKRIGFTELTRIPNAVMDGEDLVVLHMPKENCKFWTPRSNEAVYTQEVATNGR